MSALNLCLTIQVSTTISKLTIMGLPNIENTLLTILIIVKSIAVCSVLIICRPYQYKLYFQYKFKTRVRSNIVVVQRYIIRRMLGEMLIYSRIEKAFGDLKDFEITFIFLLMS